MLILIAGITGNIGHHAAEHGLAKGHQIRGLGRNPSKLSATTATKLESFITSSNYYDIQALDQACKGADAVICAYMGMPELHLDAQLLLLRAAERAGVKRYLIGAKSNSETNPPLHIFSGILAEVFFGTEGQAGFTPKDGGVWDPVSKGLDIWGDGKGEWYFTTEEDAGKWGIEAVVADGAEHGGFITVCSWVSNLVNIKTEYEKVRGISVGLHHKGPVEQLEQQAMEAKKQLGYRGMWDWHRSWFMLFSLKGVWNLSGMENDRFPDVQATSFRQFLDAHPEV